MVVRSLTSSEVALQFFRRIIRESRICLSFRESRRRNLRFSRGRYNDIFYNSSSMELKLYKFSRAIILERSFDNYSLYILFSPLINRAYRSPIAVSQAFHTPLYYISCIVTFRLKNLRPFTLDL